MAIKIEIPDNDVAVLVEFYGVKLKNIREQKSLLEVKEKEFESMIAKLRQAMTGENGKVNIFKQLPSEKDVYDPKGTVIAKITYVLEENNTPMTSKEIIDTLLLIDPLLNADKAKAAKNVSTILSINSKENGVFRKIEAKGERTKYALK